MNGKKAKLLRSLAGGDQRDTKYQVVKGTQVRKRLESYGQKFEYTTATIQRAPGPRALYQTLKRGYLNGIRNKGRTLT